LKSVAVSLRGVTNEEVGAYLKDRCQLRECCREDVWLWPVSSCVVARAINT